MSSHGARHMTIDLKDVFLKLGLFEHGHIRIKLSTMPTEFAENHDLPDLADTHGHVCEEVRGGMRGLTQVRCLAYENLLSHSEKNGCKPVKFVPGLWKHKNNGTSFTLVADNFGVKFYKMKPLECLINDLQCIYEI